MFCFGHLHAFLERPWVFSRALGCGARRGLACKQRHKFWSRAGSAARALGVQSREIWRVITGLLSAELDPSKTIETPHVSHYCCKAQQHGNNNRFNFCSVLQLRALLCVCGPLLHMCGHDVCVYALCVCALRVRVRVSTGLSMTHASTRLLCVGKDVQYTCTAVSIFSSYIYLNVLRFQSIGRQGQFLLNPKPWFI